MRLQSSLGSEFSFNSFPSNKLLALQVLAVTRGLKNDLLFANK